MSGIDSVQQIVATIRAQMAARVGPAEPQRKASQTRDAKSKTAARSQPSGAQQRMGGLIARRMQALDPDDPNRGRKAFRIFLESVLLAEFGDELINDPAFYEMADQVQRAMEADPRLSDAIGKAVAGLLGVQVGGGR